jgi:hypothetical protein
MFAELPWEKFSKNYIVNNIPAFSVLKKRFGLILVNCHFSLNKPRHTVLGYIEVAGLHIEIGGKLPEVRLMCYWVSGICPPLVFRKQHVPETGTFSVLKLNDRKHDELISLHKVWREVVTVFLRLQL